MPTPDPANHYAPAPSIGDLRSRILTDAPAPATDVADFALVTREARLAMDQDDVAARPSEVRVRLAGVGVPGHHVPVHVAAQLLDALQGAITAVGSSVHKAKKIKAPKDPDTGKRLGIRKATELRLSPTIGAGSVVFFLEGRPEKLRGDELLPGGTDSLVDTAVAELFSVLEKAQADTPDQIGVLTDELKRHGAMVASKLNALAEHTVDSAVDLDLGHRSPSGSRHAVVLKKRGADAIKEAVERNKERVEEGRMSGVLNTVSDGADRIRMTLEDGETQVRMSVEPAVGINLGAMLGKRVEAEVATKIKWKLASGREQRTYTLLSAQLADAEGADEGTLDV